MGVAGRVLDLKTGGQVAIKLIIKADIGASGQASTASAHVRGEGSCLTNDKGAVLEDYTAKGYDFSGGKIGIRTHSEVLVRSDNP
jgi:hypothetical protein